MKPRALWLTLALLALVWPSRAQTPPSDLGPRVLHLPVLERRAEQGILTPVPIVVALPPDLALAARRVLVHYRVWGDPDWTALDLGRDGEHWRGAIPCLEVSTITGDVKYYVRIHDAEGRVLASAGSRVKPFKVTIRHDTARGPNASRKGRCPDPSDCPRGLPGCPSEEVREIPCNADSDCEGAAICSWRGFCENVVRPKNWLSLSLQQDAGVISTTSACTVQSQEQEGFACYRQSDGKNYTGNPVATNEPLAAGLGPTRVVLGYDRLIHYDTSLGLRAGYAFAGIGPTVRGGSRFVPWSLSLRATHWFGDDPFARATLRPYAFITAGYGMFDISTTSHVREDPRKFQQQGGNELEQTLDVHKRAGDGFAGLGGGMALALTPSLAVGAELSVVEVFPFRATVFSASAGPMLGF